MSHGHGQAWEDPENGKRRPVSRASWQNLRFELPRRPGNSQPRPQRLCEPFGREETIVPDVVVKYCAY